jgi:hypothetical protein
VGVIDDNVVEVDRIREAERILEEAWSCWLDERDDQREDERFLEAEAERGLEEESQGIVEEAWSSWLQGKTYDAFWTQTFKIEAVYPGQALQRGVRLLRKFHKSWHKRYKVPCRPVAFLACEPHVLGSFHIHALVQLPTCLSPSERSSFVCEMWLMAKDMHGRNAIGPIRNLNDTIEYASKYVSKSGCDWIILGR